MNPSPESPWAEAPDPLRVPSDLDLASILDLPAIQALMEDFQKLTQAAVALLDLKGRVLLATGWQDACMQFHRVHPEMARNCTESDLFLSGNGKPGQYVAYPCRNGLWDVVTPLIIDGLHMGNIYTGQFFYDDQVVDLQAFAAAAEAHGLDRNAYLEAIAKIPRISRNQVKTTMDFLMHLTTLAAEQGLSAWRARQLAVEQAKALEALVRSQESYKALFASVLHGIIYQDPSGAILSANPAAERILGLSLDQLQGRAAIDPSWRVIHEDGSPFPSEAFPSMETLREGKPVSDVVMGVLDDQRSSPTWIEASAVPLFRQGEAGPYLVCTTFLEITSRKEAEENERVLTAQLHHAQRLDALGQLAGGIAHDTNNMLSVIIGYTDLLTEDDTLALRTRNDLGQIRKAALHSAELIRQLLAFARRQTIQPQAANLNVQVEDTQQMLRRLIGEQHTLVWKPGANLWNVWVDPSQVDQVLANLTVNARDALAPGGTITLETANIAVDEAYAHLHPEAVPGDYVVLMVTDTGHGMSPEVQAHIFEPFFTTKGPGRGTGLGLATVYGIVRQNKGFITIYSALGQGTTFRIHLPRYQGEEGARAASAELDMMTGMETILLVEDEEALLVLGQRLLEAAGYRVLATSRPLEALRLVQESCEDITLVATDLVMPELNGRELFEKIHALRPAIRALFLSGYPSGTISLEHLPEGGTGFLQKPFTRLGLLRKVREVLES